MSLENALCAAQQADAVLTLILENDQKWIEDETARHALYSVQENIGRVLKEVDRCFDSDRVTTEVLSDMGVLNQYAERLAKRKKL